MFLYVYRFQSKIRFLNINLYTQRRNNIFPWLKNKTRNHNSWKADLDSPFIKSIPFLPHCKNILVQHLLMRTYANLTMWPLRQDHVFSFPTPSAYTPGQQQLSPPSSCSIAACSRAGMKGSFSKSPFFVMHRLLRWKDTSNVYPYCYKRSSSRLAYTTAQKTKPLSSIFYEVEHLQHY